MRSDGDARPDAEPPYRAPGRSELHLAFGATHACAACRVRFARRAECPECGARDPVSLVDREGRESFAYRTRRANRGSSPLLRLAAWAPERIGLTIVVALLMIAPAVVLRVVFGPTAFLKAWINDDLTTTYEGLSDSGLSILGLAALGAVLLAFVGATRLAARSAPASSAPPPIRVHVAPPKGDTVLSGVARQGTIEIESPLGGHACLAFGVHGKTPSGVIADADGGDFDLELAGGERVLVSLEHAVLVVDASAEVTSEHRVAGGLEELLEARGLGSVTSVAVAETVVRAGDHVEVAGHFAEGASVALAGGKRARILAGSEERPLAVRLVTSAAGS